MKKKSINLYSFFFLLNFLQSLCTVDNGQWTMNTSPDIRHSTSLCSDSRYDRGICTCTYICTYHVCTNVHMYSRAGTVMSRHKWVDDRLRWLLRLIVIKKKKTERTEYKIEKKRNKFPSNIVWWTPIWLSIGRRFPHHIALVSICLRV